MNRPLLLPSFLGLLAALAFPGPAAAQWAVGGNPVCTAARSQVETRDVADGAGGVIVCWADIRNGSWDLYAQRLNSAGQPMWTLDGVPFCRARGDQDPLGMVADGAGGAIVVWHDYRCGSGIFAQRIDGAGHPSWTADGVPVADTSSSQGSPVCASDGRGGVIVYWLDSRGWVEYGQRLDAQGLPRWGYFGRRGPFGYASPALAADGAGGVFAAYPLSNGMFAQHVDSTGASLWPGGVTLCSGSSVAQPTVVADDVGGMIAAWTDGRLVSHPHIFGQRVGPGGAPLWQPNGVAVCIANNDQDQPAAVGDGAHGAIVTWRDARSMAGTDLYARRIGASGDTLWLPQGNPVCTSAGSQSVQSVVPDGQGGAIVAWQDGRDADLDLYAQRVAHDGTMRWTHDGVALCSVAGDQVAPQLVADDHGGAIAAWSDVRVSIATVHVYAQRVDSSGGAPGNTGVPATPGRGFRILAAAPNPARAGATIVFELPRAGPVTADVFDTHGRRVRTLAARVTLPAGRNELAWDGREANGAAASAGLYFLRVRAGAEEGRCKLVLVR